MGLHTRTGGEQALRQLLAMGGCKWFSTQRLHKKTGLAISPSAGHDTSNRVLCNLHTKTLCKCHPIIWDRPVHPCSGVDTLSFLRWRKDYKKWAIFSFIVVGNRPENSKVGLVSWNFVQPPRHLKHMHTPLRTQGLPQAHWFEETMNQPNPLSVLIPPQI